MSEFFADELALVLNCSRTAATVLADAAMMLLDRLPATWAALADGRLDWPRARALAAELLEPARDLEPQVIAEVEAAVLPRASDLSITRLRAAARGEVLRRDAAAADRRRRTAERAADVMVHPAFDGMAQLSAFLPAPLAAAIRETVDTYARMARCDGDARPLGQLRVGVLGDLVPSCARGTPVGRRSPPTSPWLPRWAPLPPAAPATTPARSPACPCRPVARPMIQKWTGPPPQTPGRPVDCGHAAPAEVDGQPITAAHVRDLLEQLDALCPGGLQAPATGSLDLALVDPLTGALRATVTRAELARLAGRGCPDHPMADCGCAVVDRPPPVDRYRPTPGQRRYATVRDRTCRHAGCSNDAGWADLDHVVPHADGGNTAYKNLCCLCRRHHRLKTHAPGWRFQMDADGVLTVTTPSGVTRVTRPPGMHSPAGALGPPLLDHDPAPF